MDKASEADESFEISQRTKSAIYTVNRNLVEPTKRYSNEVGMTDVALSIGRVTTLFEKRLGIFTNTSSLSSPCPIFRGQCVYSSSGYLDS